jgi:hypothetical protein
MPETANINNFSDNSYIDNLLNELNSNYDILISKPYTSLSSEIMFFALSLLHREEEFILKLKL